MALEKLEFTKDWNNPEDFPTYEPSESKVRADMQLLYDEIRDYLNKKVAPAIDAAAKQAADAMVNVTLGGMSPAIYDTQNKRTDIFKYIDSVATEFENKVVAVYNVQISFNSGVATYQNDAITVGSAVFVQLRVGTAGGAPVIIGSTSKNGEVTIWSSSASETTTRNVNILIIKP